MSREIRIWHNAWHGPDGALTTIGNGSTLRVLACNDSPLSEAGYLQILVNVADEVPLDFQAMDCP